MSEQNKVYDFISHELIGPKDGEKEFIESVNPSDLYLLGKIHPKLISIVQSVKPLISVKYLKIFYVLPMLCTSDSIVTVR